MIENRVNRKRVLIAMTSALVIGLVAYFMLNNSDIAINEEVIINEINFPDEAFRKDISAEFDTDGDGILSRKEIS